MASWLFAILDQAQSSSGAKGQRHQTTTSASALAMLLRHGTTALRPPRPKPKPTSGRNLLLRRSSRLPAAPSHGCHRRGDKARQPICCPPPSDVAVSCLPDARSSRSGPLLPFSYPPLFNVVPRVCGRTWLTEKRRPAALAGRGAPPWLACVHRDRMGHVCEHCTCQQTHVQRSQALHRSRLSTAWLERSWSSSPLRTPR